MRERHTTIEFKAFGQYRVLVVVNQNLETSIGNRLDSLQEKTVPDDIETIRAITYHIDDIKESVIFLRRRCSLADIVHECWHVIYRMFQYFGAALEDEVVAYHLDYLCQEVFSFVFRTKTRLAS